MKEQKDLIKENKALKASLAELVHWELQMDSIQKDCQRITDMFWQIEKNHWEETGTDNDNHIFINLNNIKNWLEGQRRDNEQT